MYVFDYFLFAAIRGLRGEPLTKEMEQVPTEACFPELPPKIEFEVFAGGYWRHDLERGGGGGENF